MLEACQDIAGALDVVYLELRVVGVQRAVSMFIVFVQVVATCTNLACAASAGVDAHLRPRVTARVRAEASGCDCARAAVTMFIAVSSSGAGEEHAAHRFTHPVALYI